MSSDSSIKDLYIEAGQEHLFKHVDSLSDDERESFYSHLAKLARRIPPKMMFEAFKKSKMLLNEEDDSTAVVDTLPESSYQSIIGNTELAQEYCNLGIEAIKNGEVAVILMAGGQGTRLGSSSPKGCYDINLPSHKSLFQIQAEKLLTLQILAGSKKVIPWYIMTSEPTRAATEKFFNEHDNFGLNKEQIFFFNQGTLPALNADGTKMFLDDPVSLVQAPDGNGGLYHAIRDAKLMEDFEMRGIKHIYMYCVDNVLSKLADPVFIGFAIKHKFQLATKAVRKRDAHESVGLIASKNSKPCVIEYSEISKELAEARDENGLLTLRAANIVNHYYSMDLLKSQLDHWCDNSMYHIANKKIPYYDNVSRQYVKPEEPNGVKLEQFIFDIFPQIPMERFGCLEVDRSEEFSPLKNGPGSSNDNPTTSRDAYLKLGTSWLSKSGAIVQDNILVEVSNTLSYNGENLEQFKNKVFDKNDILLE